jgi:hypothetical protein
LWGIGVEYWRKLRNKDYRHHELFISGMTQHNKEGVAECESEAIAAFMCSQLRQQSGCRNDTYFWEDTKDNYYQLYERQDILDSIFHRIVGGSTKYWINKLSQGHSNKFEKNVCRYLSSHGHIGEESNAYIPAGKGRDYIPRTYKTFFQCVDERVKIIKGVPTHCDICIDYEDGTMQKDIDKKQRQLDKFKGPNKTQKQKALKKAQDKLEKAKRHAALKEHQRKYIMNEVRGKMPDMVREGKKPVMVWQDFVSPHGSDGKKIYVLVWVIEWVEVVGKDEFWFRQYVDHVLRKERDEDKSSAAFVIHCWRSSLKKSLFDNFDLIIPVSDNGRHFIANELMFFFSCVETHTIHYHMLPPRHAWNRCDGHGGVWLNRMRTVQLERRVRYESELKEILESIADTQAFTHADYDIKRKESYTPITLITQKAEFFFPKDLKGIIATRPFSGQEKGGDYRYECLIKNHDYVCKECINTKHRLVFKRDCACV